MKPIQIILLVLIIVGIGLLGTQKYWVTPVVNLILSYDENPIKVEGSGFKWSGKITEVKTACFYDGVCSVTVGGKEVILDEGEGLGPRPVSGKILGADSIGDLENYIGEEAKVYVGTTERGGYTLLGNTDYYIEVIK